MDGDERVLALRAIRRLREDIATLDTAIDSMEKRRARKQAELEQLEQEVSE